MHLHTLGPAAIGALSRLLSFEDVQQVCDRGPAGEGWQSPELMKALGDASAIVDVADYLRPVMLCGCEDFMACEHPYPQRMAL